MAQNFQYTFTCEKCGGEFYSKVDPSGWKHHVCNACSGKQYKDYPAPSKVKPVYNNSQTNKVEKKEFNLDEYITDIISTYLAIAHACDEAKLTIPIENLCAWTTGAMIQKGRM